MNKFNFLSNRCGKSTICRASTLSNLVKLDGALNKSNEIKDSKSDSQKQSLTTQEVRQIEQDKEEKEIVHEVEPEEQKYLPAEKLIKQIIKSQRGGKRKKSQRREIDKTSTKQRREMNISRQCQVDDSDIDRILRSVKRLAL